MKTYEVFSYYVPQFDYKGDFLFKFNLIDNKDKIELKKWLMSNIKEKYDFYIDEHLRYIIIQFTSIKDVALFKLKYQK